MNTDHPLDRAAKLLQGRERFAALLGVTPAAIGNWKSRGVPIEHCPEIERLTDKAVNRPELRPNDWRRIWPELAEALDEEDAKQVHIVGPVSVVQEGVAHG